MEKYDVSIVVPVYNRESIIKPCIESINSQTYDKSKWEVIFVDDASKDKSIETIESLIDKDVNYRILKRPVGSGNASTPRNEGIKASLAEYIFFLDSDDYIDSQLLEKCMEMASRNDSDIVYVKIKGVGRRSPLRAFKVDLVKDADVLKNHLLRSLGPMKFMKLDLLNKNNILFIPSIDKAEDKVFMVHALTKAKKVSILSDKDYYFLIGHEGEHLSQKLLSIDSFYQTIFLPLSYIYVMSDKDYDKKRKLYNAWLVNSVERIGSIIRKADINNEEFENMFQTASNYFNMHKELFDLSQIYKNESLLTLLFLSGDYKDFHKLANESKTLQSLERVLKRKFQDEVAFVKCWIFKNRVTVLDFIINDNKIAFDFQVNEKERDIKVWMLSRNKAESLKHLCGNNIDVKNDKILIFTGKLDDREEAITTVAGYLDKLKKLQL